MKAIGIDLGTTSICGIVLDAESGTVLQSQTIPSEAFIETPNEWEKIQDPSKILAIAHDILDAFLEEYADEVLSIGITGQMHGIVYVDAEGNAASPLYTWQDARGNLPYQNTTYADHLGSFAGYGNVTDFYNRENGIVPPHAVTYCTIHDYLGMELCQNKKPIMHISNAASLGLYDMEKQTFRYHYSVDTTDRFQIIGTYKGIPVSVAIGDNQASVFATLANEEDLLINVGTGSQISIVSRHPIVAENIECRPYVEGKYLIVGAALCGGRAYSLLKDFYRALFQAAGCEGIDVYRVMDDFIAQKTQTALKVDTRFAGTRANPHIKGSISNIGTDDLTPSDLTYGVLCGMMEELHGMYCAMGEKRSGIVASGNGVRKNKALIRIAEQTFHGKLRFPLYTEEAACGAALFALVACGKFAHAADAQKRIQYEEV